MFYYATSGSIIPRYQEWSCMFCGHADYTSYEDWVREEMKIRESQHS